MLPHLNLPVKRAQTFWFGLVWFGFDTNANVTGALTEVPEAPQALAFPLNEYVHEHFILAYVSILCPLFT